MGACCLNLDHWDSLLVGKKQKTKTKTDCRGWMLFEFRSLQLPFSRQAPKTLAGVCCLNHSLGLCNSTGCQKYFLSTIKLKRSRTTPPNFISAHVISLSTGFRLTSRGPSNEFSWLLQDYFRVDHLSQAPPTSLSSCFFCRHPSVQNTTILH